MRSRWSAFVGLSFAALASACAVRGLPAHSLARYARANGGEQVRLAGAVSGGYARETEPASAGGTEAEALAVPLAEVGGTYRLHELYGASVTASPGLLTIEGQLRFGDPSAAVAILHGIGGGVTAFGDDPTFQLNLVGGVFAQLGIDAQNFVLLGGRYVFDDLYGGGSTPTPAGVQRGQHWIGAGAGWLGQLFSFFGIGAELHGGVIARVDGSPTAWFLLLTVTLSAAF
jgi:hypothetical protein